MSLPRYPKYKGSGVPWLGEMSGHFDRVFVIPANGLPPRKRGRGIQHISGYSPVFDYVIPAAAGIQGSAVC